MAKQKGATPGQIDGLTDYERGPFSEREKLGFRSADRLHRSPYEIDDEFYASLRNPGAITGEQLEAAHGTFTKHIRERLESGFGRVNFTPPREDSEASDPAPIQKIMSAPIVDEEGDVLGVIQISRKGPAPISAGPDFTIDDLHRLEKAAAIVAKMSFLR